MRIHFERHGGFAGMRMAADIDSRDLPEDEVRALEDELAQACFFDLPEHICASESGVDRFTYAITVEEGKKRHTVEVGDGGMSDSLQSLVEHLNRLARSARSG